MKTLALVALLALPCLADDLVMKDGRTLSWKSLSDEGDSYSLVAKDGTVTRVKKADVEKFIVPREAAEPLTGPLTGASFSFAGKKTSSTNLIPKAFLERATAWKMAGAALLAEQVSGGYATVSFDNELPEEYDLTLVAERISGNKSLVVGVGIPGGLCGYALDASDATESFLVRLAGDTGEHTKGKVFKAGKPTTVKLSVRKDSFLVQVDGKETWKGRVAWSQGSVFEKIRLSDAGKLYLAAEGSFKVHAFSLTLPTTAK